MASIDLIVSVISDVLLGTLSNFVGGEGVEEMMMS